MNVIEFIGKVILIWCISYGSIVIASLVDIPLWLVVLLMVGVVHSLITAFIRILRKGDIEEKKRVDS